MKHSNEFDYNTCLMRISVKDDNALELLYREMKDPIYRYALTLLHDHSTAEDALQITFLKIMANADSYRPGITAKAWIYTIVRNTCLDILRQRMPVVDDGFLESFSDNGMIDSLTDSIAVKEALSKLNSTEREIVSLYAFAGLKQTEIAKVMKMPYVKVRSVYGYAIKKLRKELADYDK